jgi:Leucine-rich repeat (LRR) protein/chitodextrinase
MKKDAAFSLAALAVLAALSISVVGAAADPVVIFPDFNLEQAIREAIVKPSGDIHESDLAPLTVLAASSKGIVNLEGIQHCVNLTDLNLGTNQISDIGPLSGLANLTDLNLNRNQITDISPLSGLARLDRLSLSINQINDISPLSGLTSLVSLYLGNNQIENIDAISGLTKLTSLSFYNNKKISDISALLGMTKLTYLNLQHNQIGDIGVLSGRTTLRDLELGNNQIGDISALSGMTNLEELGLGGNRISDISVLSAMTNLYMLELHSNEICDISVLEGMVRLWYLNVGRNQISDIGPLVANPGLGAGDEVGISRNWLCLAPGSEDMDDVDELLNRVVDLYYSPQLVPSDLSATAVSPTGIDLQWDGDDVVHEDGFRIERNEGGGPYSEIATVGPDAVAYSDTGLASLTTYCYRVRATNACGETCYSNDACAMTPVSPPVAAFTYAPGCAIAGAEIAFTDASADDGAVVAWAWGFGDGSTSTERHPLHRFASFGSYTVTLRVTDDDGATDETSQVVRVYLRGDLNGDDLVDLIDVLMLHRHVHDGVEFDACQGARADIDDDGDVDEDDAQALADRVFVR